MTTNTTDLNAMDIPMDMDLDMGLSMGMDIPMDIPEVAPSIDINMDTLFDDNSADTEVETEVAEKPVKKHQSNIFGKDKKTTTKPVKAVVEKKVKRSLFTPKSVGREERVIEKHQQYPREMFMGDMHDQICSFLFATFTEFEGQTIPKSFTKSLVEVVENCVADTITNHPIKFAGLNIKHSAIVGRLNPNPQGGKEQTFTTGYVAIKVNEAATPRAVIRGLVTENGFVAGNLQEDGSFIEASAPVSYKVRGKHGKDEVHEEDANVLIAAGKATAEAMKAAKAKRAPASLLNANKAAKAKSAE